MSTCNICSKNDVDWHFRDVDCRFCKAQIIFCNDCDSKYGPSGKLTEKHNIENHLAVDFV